MAKKPVKQQEYREVIYSAERWTLLENLRAKAMRIMETLAKAHLEPIVHCSIARGDVSKESDIDIYLDTKDPKLKEQVELIDSKISAKTGAYDKNSLLIKEIEKNHVILKGAEAYYEKNRFFD